ncbi:MAG TPA: 5-oxoprolinase subunit PxpA, partial [Gemmatales bacterium]|nr:5-oxoprolinase subunit PxpA [Gemmatales bacterium]
MLHVHFNADIGEGYQHDAALLHQVQAVNIACTAHAGTPADIVHALRLAREQKLEVGAHPGYFDREYFGRREQPITPEELYATVRFQLAGFLSLAYWLDTPVTYFKPHGAMYHQCHREPALAHTLATLALEFQLAVLGLPAGELEKACQQLHVRYLREGFADRRYTLEGNLVPRREPDALLHDPHEAALQIHRLIAQHAIDSFCVHGDSPEVVTFLLQTKQHLQKLDRPS